MKKWWDQLKEEYYETCFNSSEDWLEWFIKRKMTWGWRWILVVTFVFCIDCFGSNHETFFVFSIFYVF